MKLFSAIIAAAVVIISALWAIARVNDWERSKQSYQRSIRAEWGAAKEAGSGYRDLTDAALAFGRAVKRAEAQALGLKRKLLVIYENKPFGLPLSEQDRKDRYNIKQEIDKQTPNTDLSQLHEDTRRVQRKLEAPTPTQQPVATKQHGTWVPDVEPDTSMKRGTTTTPQTNR